MAVYPCDEGAHRYPGPSQSVYLAVLDGGSSWRRKFRLCPRHFDMFEERLQRDFVDSVEDVLGARIPTCPSCHEEVHYSNAAAFATVYARGVDRKDYWAPVCAEHVFPLRAVWGMDTEPHVGAPETL